ncbi:uncharacterized protein LOC128219452 [Mya arenaria]|uniref:uncharacterized protein LOC128219452 n=1 Tax=Mya arenaria TaxID=6604 RepID=UPI0022E8BB74|nr:uncharacterized protein LOC128219452 [Mya arenaria]
MELVEDNSKQVSINAVLRQQVDEQKKIFAFSKRYHTCVMYASPFVQAMMRNNFKEKAKGFLELKLGSSEYIDMAIMSLYGKYPKLTMDNVSSLINLAEFLLMQDLKAFCVKFINKKINVNEENVEKLLHLTSLYDFEMPKLSDYIRQNLLELLGGNQLLTITADTLENLLPDETLSYVNADVRFEFLMRWVEHSPEQRRSNLDKLVACVDLTEVAAVIIEKAKVDKNFQNLQTVFEIEHDTVVKLQNVLITHKDRIYTEFWVFDLCQERWFTLELSTPDPFEKSFTFNSSEPTLCLVERANNQCKIRLQDFGGDQFSCTFLRLVTSHDLNIRSLDNMYISDKTCYVVLLNKRTNCEREYTCRKPTLFFGAISECGDETTLTPTLSVNVDFDVQLVVNEAKCIAFFQ